MRGVSGYATITSPEGFKREADTFTCGHCQKVVHIKPMAPLDEVGGRCTVCDTLICPGCVTTGKCEPFEKKLRRLEERKRYL